MRARRARAQAYDAGLRRDAPRATIAAGRRAVHPRGRGARGGRAWQRQESGGGHGGAGGGVPAGAP
eukprot:2333755-Pleurochrysis_carterae.AAC.1